MIFNLRLPRYNFFYNFWTHLGDHLTKFNAWKCQISLIIRKWQFNLSASHLKAWNCQCWLNWGSRRFEKWEWNYFSTVQLWFRSGLHGHERVWTSWSRTSVWHGPCYMGSMPDVNWSPRWRLERWRFTQFSISTFTRGYWEFIFCDRISRFWSTWNRIIFIS